MRETGGFRTSGSTELLSRQAMWMGMVCGVGGRTPSKISWTPELFNQQEKSERSANKGKGARKMKGRGINGRQK